jgi:hypothetical protein
MTTLRHDTHDRWGQIRRARWGQIKWTFPIVWRPESRSRLRLPLQGVKSGAGHQAHEPPITGNAFGSQGGGA